MVAEPWIYMMRKKESQRPPVSEPAACGPAVIGILSFEVAGAMSRAVNLHRSLSEPEVARLHSEVLASPGVRTLVSPHEPRLLALAAAERLDDLNRVAAVAARLGRRCPASPALQAFDHVYADLLADRLPPPRLSAFLSKDMTTLARKMERLAAATATLYAELEALDGLEQSAKKLPADEDARRAVHQKIQWQKHDIKQLRSTSLWNQNYDKVTLLLARAVCTIHSGLRQVFGDAMLNLECFDPDQSQQLSGPMTAVPHRRSPHSASCLIRSAPILSNSSIAKSGQISRIGADQPKPQPISNIGGEGLRFHCGSSPGRLFLECLSLSSSALSKDSEGQFDGESYVTATGSLIPFSGVPFSGEYKCTGKNEGGLWFGPKSRLTSLALPSTVGGSALALHYANIIIIIEKFLKYPHLVGEEARDDLYQMLPSSLRAGLKRSLKSYVKSLAIYDAPLADDWKEALHKILNWLAPMAHNMIRWQTEHNFEQQQIVQRANVLLLQTLYFADREKTEAAICELLVGLNYICRYEQQQNALLDCTSSLDFDNCMDWQMKY